MCGVNGTAGNTHGTVTVLSKQVLDVENTRRHPALAAAVTEGRETDVCSGHGATYLDANTGSIPYPWSITSSKTQF